MTPSLCLALAIYFEARAEPIMGHLAVGQVIMNRVEDSRWPDTVCGVVLQPWQFSFYWDGKPDVPDDQGAWNKALLLSQVILDGGTREITDALFYHATYVDPGWGEENRAMQIGDHIFYRDIKHPAMCTEWSH